MIDLTAIKPARLLLFGYLSYMLVGWVFLSLPFSQLNPVAAIDSLFISVSAISTTGLVTLNPASNFNMFGMFVILILIQAGGIGYMTFSSFIILSRSSPLNALRTKICSSNFAIPGEFEIKDFIKAVIIFTFVVEIIGATFLFCIFGAKDGYSFHTAFSALFHSISAFCTAGFSLNSDSLEGFRDNAALNIVIVALCYMGAIGFIVWTDVWRFLSKKTEHITFTSKVILQTTFWFALIGTAVFFVIEPSIQNLEPHLRLNAALFQVMTSTTTVGFNTISFGDLSTASVVLVFFLMIFGASPSGTGGGLKSTTFSALVGLLRSTLKDRDSVRFMKRTIPPKRLQIATASFVYFFFAVGFAFFLLSLTETVKFEPLLFEILSAVGTVGVSMGATPELTVLGKLIIVVLMTMGRVGIMTFGMAVSSSDETLEEISKNDIVI